MLVYLTLTTTVKLDYYTNNVMDNMLLLYIVLIPTVTDNKRKDR